MRRRRRDLSTTKRIKEKKERNEAKHRDIAQIIAERSIKGVLEGSGRTASNSS